MNIQPSQRVQQIKEYYFSTKLKEIAALRSRGIDIISLGIGGPDLPPPSGVITTMAEAVHPIMDISHMSVFHSSVRRLPDGMGDGMG